MSKLIITAIMLACSNIFMTFAWYGHLKNYNDKPWIVAALISWSIALFEYLIQVPAIGIRYLFTIRYIWLENFLLKSAVNRESHNA